MTKGQFAALTTALGLAMMAGTGYIAYANTNSHGSGAHSGAGSDTEAGSGAGAAAQPTWNAGGAGATPAAQDAGKPTAAVPDCGDSDIQVSTTDNEGAAGHISLVLVFTNSGGHDCVLHGYPGASLLDGNGRDLLDATRTLSGDAGGAVGLSVAPHVLLHPDATASAVLEWTDVPTGSGANGGACQVQDAVSLAVTPPNTTATTTLSMPAQTDVCAGFQIHPVLLGVGRKP
jgi:hypothetical protein